MCIRCEPDRIPIVWVILNIYIKLVEEDKDAFSYRTLTFSQLRVALLTATKF